MDLPKSQHIYRYWVELRDRRDGSARKLPLQGLKRIHLSAKKGAPKLPDEVVFQVKDGSEVMEAPFIEELAAQLRSKYPDETFERFLHQERDREAEQRKAEAIESLVELLARAALKDVLREDAELHKDPSHG